MISTVTTTTVTTIITLTSGLSLSIIASIILVSLLGTRELVFAEKKIQLKKLSRYLNVSILPLLIVFLLTIAIKVAELTG
jgi:hypothetical protein